MIKSRKILLGFLVGGLVVASLGGCTVGMMGDMGKNTTHVNLTGDSRPAISPDAVQVKDIEIQGVTMSPEKIDEYMKKNLPNAVKLADLTAGGSGYGDDKQKAIERAKRRCASIGANLLVVTGESEGGMAGAFGAIEGGSVTTISAVAYYNPS